MKSVKTKFFFSLTVLSLVILASCGDKKSGNSAPTLTIEEPEEGATVALSDSLHMHIIAADDEELHEMSVVILSHMGDTLFAEYPYVHAQTSYSFHEHFHPTMAGMHHLHVNVSDHDDNVTEKEVMFTVQ